MGGEVENSVMGEPDAEGGGKGKTRTRAKAQDQVVDRKEQVLAPKAKASLGMVQYQPVSTSRK